MAIPIHTTRKHIWRGLSLFCVLWFELFHIKCIIFHTFFIHGDILKNMPKLHSLCVCMFPCMQVQCVCGWRQARGQSVVSFFRRHPPVLIYLVYTGSFTGLELIKLTRLARQWTLGICLFLQRWGYKHLPPCLLLFCGFKEFSSGPLAWKKSIFLIEPSHQPRNDTLINSTTQFPGIDQFP